MPQKFVHLHCHTEYSLLEAPVRIKALLKACLEDEMPAVAMTDNGVMYGAIDMYTQAKSKGIKPLIGCEMFLTPDITKKEKSFQRLVLLCKDYQGYQSLIKLVTISHLEGFYYKPRIDFEHLKQYSKGLIAISPGGRGPIADFLRSGNKTGASEIAAQYKAIYKDDFYLGIQRVNLPFEEVAVSGSIELAHELDIPLVAANDVYHITKKDANFCDILTGIQTGRILEEGARFRRQTHETYLKSTAEMIELFSDVPEAIENTVKIAEKCDLNIETEQVLLPRFDCPDNKESSVYLEELVWDGINSKYDKITDEIKDRVEFELSIINKMEYAQYFLIIYDFLEHSRKNSIPVGPGRGSAAGSIVSYALDITKIDPVRYKLLFERFLNPERVSMPDIDIDFCIRRRGEVINYIVEKYGEDRVSQIITFGTMGGRGVIRDVGRVLNVPLNEVDRIAKLIPSGPAALKNIHEAIEQVPELKKIYNSSEEHKELLDTGAKLEGISRHTSTHAAGVVISRDPLTTIVPLARNDGQAMTQYQMTDIEKIGLLKMDILGLRNLTVIKDTLDLIKEEQGIDLDLDNIPIDDKKTYSLLKSGHTMGIFQLESRGMQALIKDLKPEVFEDLIALLALYRPGPLGSGMVQDFISNKSGKTKVKYPLPELEQVLKETYGMIVYQEQVMQIASIVGGFSLGEADVLRRAMGKKKKKEMDKMREKFLDGAKEKEIPMSKAGPIFELCYKFAEYGFNKSHSAAYAQVSYQTAYLKANYPVEYMAALLSSVLGVSDKVSVYIKECSRMGIDVLPPDVNESGINFTITNQKPAQSKKESEKMSLKSIRFGLGAVKNVGEGAIESIIKNRSKEKYKNFMDFCIKVDLRQVNKRVLDSAIKSGAFDCIGERSELLGIYEKTLEAAQVMAREKNNGQESLFSNMKDNGLFIDIPADSAYTMIPAIEKLRMEKEMLGLYVTGHPLDEVSEKLEKMQYNTSTLTIEHDQKRVSLAGLITEVKKIITKTKREMMLAQLEDLKGSITVMLFQNEGFEEKIGLFVEGNIVYVSGRVRVNQDEISMICDGIELIEQAMESRSLYIDVENIEDKTIFDGLKQLSSNYQGTMPVYFKIDEDNKIISHKKYWLTDDELCIKQVENLVGPGHYWVS
jgi:DNA polymerase III subunit alpha